MTSFADSLTTAVAIAFATGLVGCPAAGDSSSSSPSAPVTPEDSEAPPADEDEDGWSADEDCDDDDPDVNPGAVETCNGVDDDCDEQVDDDDDSADTSGGVTVFADADGDGWGAAGTGHVVCDATGEVRSSSDCDDADASVNPGAEEVCGNGIDDDCDERAGACAIESGMAPDLAWATIAFAGSADYSYPYAVEGAGDWDGDGLPDVMVASGYGILIFPGNLEGEVTPEEAMLLEIVLGAGTHQPREPVAADIDLDGNQDLLFGSPYYGGGEVYWVLGPATGYQARPDSVSQIYGSGEARCGSDLDAGRDITGGSAPDIVIGCPHFNGGAGSFTGAVFIFQDLAGGSVSDAAVVIEGAGSFDYFGGAVAEVGDLDGDGGDDLVASRYVFTSHIGLSSTTDDADAAFTVDGYSDVLATGGDANEDGYGDFLVGAPDAYSGVDPSDSAWVLLGSATSPAGDAFALRGTDADQDEGSSVANCGDVDGDGHDDILVGAEMYRDGANTPGAAILVYGPITRDVDLGGEVVLLGEDGTSSYESVGEEVAGLGDVDGDGAADFAVLGDHAGVSGEVYLFRGGRI